MKEMNPDFLLARLREMAIRAAIDGTDDQFVRAFNDLDGHLTFGGRLPTEWGGERETV